MVSGLIQRYFAELAFLAMDVPVEQVSEAVECLRAIHARGATVFIVGNGGSAATASHFANDLIKSSRSPDGRALRAQALTDAVPVLTAIANDASYERVFAEQLAVYARAGDVLMAFSGSGNSPNVLRSVELARSMGLYTIGLTGFGGGRLARIVDLAIVVPGSRIQIVEDAHSAICHAISVGLAASLGASQASSVHAPRPAIFLDRDGVLNVRRLDHVKSMDEFEFLPGVLDALAELRRLDAPVVVITNQSVIGRGLASASDVERIHSRMQQAVAASGGPQLSVYVCPHDPEESCDCRKPRPGLLLGASAQLGLDLQRSVLVGDTMVDVFAALAVGCHPVLIGSRDQALQSFPDGMVSVVSSLAEAIDTISKRAEFSGAPANGSKAASVNGVYH